MKFLFYRISAWIKNRGERALRQDLLDFGIPRPLRRRGCRFFGHTRIITDHPSSGRTKLTTCSTFCWDCHRERGTDSTGYPFVTGDRLTFAIFLVVNAKFISNSDYSTSRFFCFLSSEETAHIEVCCEVSLS